jgi:hypothetical protein
MSFMSIAPRPQMQPPEISPEKGSYCQSLALAAGDHASALGVRFQDRGLEAGLGELGGGVFGGLALPRAGVVARIGGVDPDQVAADVDDLVLRGHVVSCHRPIVALG